MMSILQKIKTYLGWLRRLPGQMIRDKNSSEIMKKQCDGAERIFYFGVPEHSNLGDLAQCYCIREYLKNAFPDYNVIEVASRRYLDNVCGIRDYILRNINKSDIIVFQSGYCTQDIGGREDLMHQRVMLDFPDNKLLMMPQTVYFKNQDRKYKACEVYNAHQHLLFLARDRVSYETAIEMFPDRKVELFPDIVTTMIGKYSFKNDRNGVLFCIRNDAEKFYSDAEIATLIEHLSKITACDRLDTTIHEEYYKILDTLQEHIEGYFEKFSKYRVVITDRYHGTIFSLVANTPVIVIQTTDHKVKTGVDWFNGVYDDNVVFAETLEKAETLAFEFLKRPKTPNNTPYFQENYYDKLRGMLENID